MPSFWRGQNLRMGFVLAVVVVLQHDNKPNENEQQPLQGFWLPQNDGPWDGLSRLSTHEVVSPICSSSPIKIFLNTFK